MENCSFSAHNDVVYAVAFGVEGGGDSKGRRKTEKEKWAMVIMVINAVTQGWEQTYHLPEILADVCQRQKEARQDLLQWPLRIIRTCSVPNVDNTIATPVLGREEGKGKF